jgi:hypothetical protein
LPPAQSHLSRQYHGRRAGANGRTLAAPFAPGAAAIGTSYSFLVAPLISLVGLGVILLLCRWTFSTSSRESRLAARRAAVVAGRGGDFGLLVPVASVPSRDDAEALRTVLAAAGIRCTIAADADGVDVLVFRQDALRARELVSS